jgi:N6-adenosine-specific RNA methylase IME4
VKFKVILADPPWSNRKASPKQAAFSAEHYEGLSDQEIRELPVSLVADANAYLFLWVDAQHHHIAARVAEAWGFPSFSTKFTWLKTTSKGKDCPGIGRYSLVWAEDCWLFKRGNPAAIETAMQNPFRAVTRGHSRKPDELYAFIEAGHLKKRSHWVWPEPRLELFARTHAENKQLWEPRPGWTQIGNEFEVPGIGLGEDIRDALIRLSRAGNTAPDVRVIAPEDLYHGEGNAE